jgi:hypothetical protein
MPNFSQLSGIDVLVQCHNVGVVDDFLKIFAVNYQTVPNLRNIVKSGNTLVFFVWITLSDSFYQGNSKNPI